MSIISFDITYKKSTDIDSIKLSADADFQQLKIMICGRYKLYDMNTIYIFYQGKNINPEEHMKLKNIFRRNKVQIEIRDTLPIEKEIVPKYYCLCKNPAAYICDVCNEFICKFCYNLRKHIPHQNKIIELSKYNLYLKITLRDNENMINNQIIKDDGYLFLEYLDYDINNEIKTINNMYDHAKSQLEEIKKIQTNFILEFNKYNKYNEITQKIEDVISQYSNINLDDNDLNNLIEEKQEIMKKTKELLNFYDDVKMHLLFYAKNIKEIQNFNEELIAQIKEYINSTKKKFNQMNRLPEVKLINLKNINSSHKDFSNTMHSDYPIKARKKIEDDFSTKKDNNRKKFNSLGKNIKKNDKNNEKSNKGLEPKKNLKIINENKKGDSPLITENNDRKNKYKKRVLKKNIKLDRVLIRLKDETKFLIFSIDNLSFKERYFIDRANFAKNITSLDDIIQLNHDNILYMLMGKESNKIFYYNYQLNSIFFGCNTLYSHNYGSMAYCSKNNSIYLLGGSQQNNCEICNINDINNLEFKNLPQLNEERQEFGVLCFNNYLYVFFGFNSSKNRHCNSIERINVENNEKFETIYANKEIAISSLGCCKFNDKEGNEEILLLGGYNGENFLDTSLVFMIDEIKVRDGLIIIPNLDIHEQFLFYKESGFIEYEPGLQFSFDWKNNVHLLSKESYELFTEGI